MINSERLNQQFNALKNITAAGKGINRLAFSDADWQGREYLMQLMKDAGLTLRVDAFGNVIGHYAGKDESLPAVMCGSHGDSVPEGGNYDGIFGILSAIETVCPRPSHRGCALHVRGVEPFWCGDARQPGHARRALAG